MSKLFSRGVLGVLSRDTYRAAHIEISEYLLGRGETTAARLVVFKLLEQNPQDKALRFRYSKFVSQEKKDAHSDANEAKSDAPADGATPTP